jgi:hypothetical protein
LDGEGTRWADVDRGETVRFANRIVLGKLRFLARSVEILSTYSRRGAAAILWARDDIALVLLDVGMGEDDAGLPLVREIREEMRNLSLRIILRSGMTAVAPDAQVMFDYDIYVHHAKADLLDMAHYAEYEEALGPGDSGVMTTDGIAEACNARNEMFGDLRLHNALDDGIGDDPDALLDRVLRAVEGFVRGTPASNDLTCMVVRWEGTRRRDVAGGRSW